MVQTNIFCFNKSFIVPIIGIKFSVVLVKLNVIFVASIEYSQSKVKIALSFFCEEVSIQFYFLLTQKTLLLLRTQNFR